MSDRLVLKVNQITTVDKKNLRVDELYLFYHLFRYVEDGAGEPVEEGRVRLVWQKKKKEDTGEDKEIRDTPKGLRMLTPPGNDLTRAIASEITCKEHMFFSHRAVEWYGWYDKESRLNQVYYEDRQR